VQFGIDNNTPALLFPPRPQESGERRVIQPYQPLQLLINCCPPFVRCLRQGQHQLDIKRVGIADKSSPFETANIPACHIPPDETHHGGKWFKGEHDAILDRATFDRVQELLKSNTVKRRVKFSESGALLQGKLFDDNGNRMGPSFSSKNGVRYRFYLNRALRGRKDKAGSVTRVSAPEIERVVKETLTVRLRSPDDDMLEQVDQIIVSTGCLRLRLKKAKGKPSTIDVPWAPRTRDDARVQLAQSEVRSDERLLKSVVRAHAWLDDLSTNRQTSIESMAAVAGLHPKGHSPGTAACIPAPQLTSEILDGRTALALKQIPKLLPLSWAEQRRLTG
jgi:site-specific DNA recombinase